MVLHPDARRRRARQRVTRREVVGVQVVRDHLGLDLEEALHSLDRLLEPIEARHRVEVADVRAQVGVLAHRQAERVLELRAAGEHRPLDRARQRDRPRHPPARAPQQQRPARHHTRHRVVAARSDVAIVEQEEVGEIAQALERFVVAGGDRLLRPVAGRHHQRAARRLEQQVVKRRVGEEETEERVARERPRRAQRRAPHRAGGEEHDRALDPIEQRRLLGRRSPPAAAPRRDRAPSPRTASRRGPCAGAARRPPPGPGVAGEMKPAQALDRDDRSRGERLRGVADRVVARHRLAGGGPQLEARAAARTGIRLRVEAAVGGIVVLTLAAPRTSRTAPSWSTGGRRGSPATP